MYIYIYYIYIYILYIIYTHARDSNRSNSVGEVNGGPIETWSDLMFKRTGLTGSLYKDSLQSLKRTHVPGSRLGDSQYLYTRILWGNLPHVRTKNLCNEFTKSVYKGPLKELKRSLCTRHHKTKGIHRISTQRTSETHRIRLRPDLGTHKIFAQGFIRGTHRISLQGSLKANFIGRESNMSTAPQREPCDSHKVTRGLHERVIEFHHVARAPRGMKVGSVRNDASTCFT